MADPKPTEPLHPLDAHARRDPLPGAGARVVVFSGGDPAQAEEIGRGIVALLDQHGRAGESVVVDEAEGWGRALERGLESAGLPLVVVSAAVEPWTEAHLTPLLRAI